VFRRFASVVLVVGIGFFLVRCSPWLGFLPALSWWSTVCFACFSAVRLSFTSCSSLSPFFLLLLSLFGCVRYLRAPLVCPVVLFVSLVCLSAFLLASFALAHPSWLVSSCLLTESFVSFLTRRVRCSLFIGVFMLLSFSWQCGFSCFCVSAYSSGRFSFDSLTGWYCPGSRVLCWLFVSSLLLNFLQFCLLYLWFLCCVAPLCPVFSAGSLSVSFRRKACFSLATPSCVCGSCWLISVVRSCVRVVAPLFLIL